MALFLRSPIFGSNTFLLKVSAAQTALRWCELKPRDLTPATPSITRRQYDKRARKVVKPKFKLIAIAEDEKTKRFSGVIRFTDMCGKARNVLVNRADLDNRKSIAETLKNAGAELPIQGRRLSPKSS